MALVSVYSADIDKLYIADTERLYETCEAIDRSKEQFSNNPSVSSGNSSVGAITSKINELGNEIKEDYEKTSKDLRNYTNKVEANENKLKSKAVSVLENDSVVKNIPVMVTDSKTSTNEKTKTKETFADSIKPRIENNVNVNMLNSLEVAQGIVKTYERQAKATKKEETLKDIADEFFENQRKSGVFPGSAINSQNNGAFASSVGNLNSVNKAIEVDPERIAKAKENTDKINAAAREKRFEEEKAQAYMINDISDSVGTVFGNPISVVSTIKKGVFSVAKIGGYAYSGVKSLFTGEKLTDVANETIEKISDVERKTDDELIGVKLFLSEGIYSTAENLVKGVVSLGSDALINSSNATSSILESITGEKYVSTAEERLEKFLGTNWVHDKFSSFYEDNGFGNHLKNNLKGFETQRDIGSAVGAAIPTIAAGMATAGVGSVIVGGLSSTGSGTTSALQDGATLDEATNYGAAKGALSAATFGVGKAINALNIFGRGTVAQTLENAGSRILADTGLGVVTSLADDVLKQLYVPRNKFKDKNFVFSSEEEWTKASFGDKFNAYFEDAGGWGSIKNGAITGALYSTVFEGASAIKEISSINAANKVYSDVKSNVEEVNNIKNQNMLNENNSLASNSLEDLYAQRKSIQEAYDSLDDQAKYFFTLKKAKDGIASGVITSEGLDNFINSGMAKAMYGDLNNQERLSLIEKMNETQIGNFFNQIGKTKAQAFLNRNSTYFTERFFNTDSTNSAWSNDTALAITPGSTFALGTSASASNTSSLAIMNNNMRDNVITTVEKVKNPKVLTLEEDYLHEVDEIIENFGKTTSRDDPRYETLSLIDQNVKDDYRASEVTRKVNSLYDELNSKRLEFSKEIAGVTTTSSGSEVYPKITEKISQAKDEITKQISKLENISAAYKNSGGIFSKEKGISKVYDKVKGDYEALLKDLDSVETGIAVKNKAFIKSIENIEDIPAETPNSNNTGVLGELLKPLFKSNIEPTLEQKVDLYKTRINNYEEDYFASVDKMIEKFDVSAVDNNTKNEALSLIDKKIGDSPIAGAVSDEVKSYYEDLSSKASKLTEDMAKVSTTSMSVDKSSQELAKRIETVKEELETTISDLDKKGIRYRNNYSIFSKERGLSKVYDKVKGDYEEFYKKIEILEEGLAGKKAVLDSSIEQLGETTFNEKDQSKIKEIISSLEQKPSEEIVDIESIPRKRNLTTELARERAGVSESTDTTSKIGFQFFADKKSDNLYNANDMPLATDPKFRRLQDKMANGESLSMFERAIFHDKTYKNIGDYECKPNYCYRAISKEVYDIYKEKGYIVGHDNDKEYQEFVDEDGSSWSNNAGVDWYLGGYAKYGTIIIECPADKDYFVPAFDGGNHMTSDIMVKHMKSSPEQNPIPFSKITRVFDLDQIKVDEAKELSSQGKITKEFTSTLTDEQYKAILLQADENPKLVSDVIAVSHIQQIKNAIRNMDGAEIAKVIDVENIDMGFITENAINNLDESQLTDTLIRKIVNLDDEKFIEFVKGNTNSTLYNNEEIFDRAIAIATKEKIDLISGFSEEVQSKVLLNKEYMNELINKRKYPFYSFAKLIDSKLSLDNSRLLMDNFDMDKFTTSNKLDILVNISDAEKQKLFIEKTGLFDSAEWKAKDVSRKISDLEVIKDSSVRQEYIAQSGILDNVKEYSASDIKRLLKMVDDENQYKIISELKLSESDMKDVLSNSSLECLKRLYDNQKYDILFLCDTKKLLTQMDDSKTFLDAILEDVKSGKTKVSIKKLLSSGSNVDTKVQYYITLAKHDMVDYADELSVSNLLNNKNGTMLLTKLLDADEDLTVNKILSNKVKSNPQVATILKLRGLDTGKTKISFGTESYNDDYIKRFNNSLGIGPIYQKGESLLNELQELFLNDGKSDKEIVESLIVGYRQGLIVDYDNCVKELQNLVNVKKQNLNKFYYIKEKDSGYFKPITGSIYMDDAVADTSLHETGHALHEYLAQTSTPENFMEIVEKAKENPEFMKKVEEYYDYYSSVRNKVAITVRNEMDDYFKDYYTDERIEDINYFLLKSRDELEQELFFLGMMDDELDATLIDIITKGMYTPEEYIETQKRIFRNQLEDAIMRSEYGGLISIGDYIDRITDGAFQRGKLLKEDGTPMVGIYGHGFSYYFGTDHGFDEMVANFASMSKMPNAKENLQMLKDIIGEEMYDMISSYYYKNIVNYGG